MGEGLVDHLDENDVVGEVVLLRAANNNTIVIVEGGSDEKFLSYFMIEDEVDIVVAFGRDKALGAVPVIRSNFSGVLCVVDSDYDYFVGEDVSADDILVTSEHDIEMVLARSDSLGKVLHEFGSKRKIRQATSGGRSVWDILEEPVHALGTLRLYSKMNGLDLRFHGLKFRFLDRRTLAFDAGKMISEVLAHSQKPHLSVEEASAFMEEWKDRDHPRHMMCCGHDFSVVLGKALQTFLGSQSAAATSQEEVERKLRLAYSVEEFKNSKLYNDIREWETRNPPYKCLAA